MSYDYDKTSVDLYRAVFKSNFETDVGRYLKPDRELADSESIAPILHPLSPNRLASRSPGRPMAQNGPYWRKKCANCSSEVSAVFEKSNRITRKG